jgi:glycosyltransferase involved in cell wall biosynthesis
MLKVGLVGWGASTGNGGMNYDIARLAPWVTSWLCPKHPSFGWHEPYLQKVSEKVIRCEREGDVEIYSQFLDNIDAVLFIEHPYLRDYELVNECKTRGILTVCIPMWEWFPEQKSWSQHLDMVWCVTNHTRKYLETLAKYLKHRHDRCDWADKIYGNRWGVALKDFEFTARKQANRFLFINGNGGGRALRKGSGIIAEAAAMIPNIEIIMLTQRDNYVKPMPGNVKIIECNFPTKKEIYQYGDVFLAPTHWEGFGHTLYEAQACGLPIITTDAPPMDECGANWYIPVLYSEQYKLLDKPIPKVFADVQKLAQIIYDIQGSHISQKSTAARKYIERHHNLQDVIKDLGQAIESVINSIKKQEYASYIDGVGNRLCLHGEERYKFLVNNAWIAYQKKDPEQMSHFLLESFKHTSLSRTEILLDWVENFEMISAKEDINFDIQFLFETKEWKHTIQKILETSQTRIKIE